MIELKMEQDDIARLYENNNLKQLDLPDVSEVKELLLAEYVLNIVDMWLAPEGHIVITVQEG